MADESETLMRVQTELTVTRAQHNDLTFKIRQRELVDRRRVEALVFARARRIRDQMLTAPVRHAAVLAAEFGVPPAPLAHALGQIMRAALHDFARHPPKIPK
jgi:hypothetical protein